MNEEALRKRLEREERKSAAVNKENDALRVECRKLRHANYLLKQSLSNRDRINGGYIQRYNEIQEAVAVIRDVIDGLRGNGLPEPVSKTLEPWVEK